MILAWLASNKGILKGAAFVLALVLLMVAVAWFKGREEADDRSNQQVGAAVQREADQREVIKQVEQGNAARDEITSNVGSARYDQCVRTARTPANCQRLLPQRQADQR